MGLHDLWVRLTTIRGEILHDGVSAWGGACGGIGGTRLQPTMRLMPMPMSVSVRQLEEAFEMA